MKTLITKPFSAAAIVIAAAALFSMIPKSATAQVINGGAFGTLPLPVWYVPPYDSGATAYESFLRGQATVLQAEGQWARDVARANEIQADATRQWIENRDLAFQQRLQFRRMGLAQQNVAFENVKDRRDLHRALTDAERLLEESEALIRPNETRAEAKLRVANDILNGDEQPVSTESTVALEE